MKRDAILVATEFCHQHPLSLHAIVILELMLWTPSPFWEFARPDMLSK